MELDRKEEGRRKKKEEEGKISPPYVHLPSFEYPQDRER